MNAPDPLHRIGLFWDETGFRRRMSYADLHAQVSRAAQAMRAAGLKPGDRVAAFIPNMPETCVLALAAISVGAVWSSCSPDFGTDGVLDRFGQTEPKLLFCADGYLYNGKAHDSIARVKDIVAQLPCVKQVVVVSNLDAAPDVSSIRNARRFSDWIAPYKAGEIEFELLRGEPEQLLALAARWLARFDHPRFRRTRKWRRRVAYEGIEQLANSKIIHGRSKKNWRQLSGNIIRLLKLVAGTLDKLEVIL